MKTVLNDASKCLSAKHLNSKKSPHDSGKKLLQVVEALSGCAVKGISNKALASGLGMAAPAISRATEALVEIGWVRKDEASGLFHPTPRMGQIFGRVLNDLAQAQRSLDDLKHSFTTTH